MPRLSLETQFGRLTLSEEDGSIVELTWGGRASGRPTPALLDAKKQLLEYFAGRRKEFDLPLKLEGQPAALRVWQLMAEIPYGQTRTYGDLGKVLGLSPRFVGQACGSNPLPIFVPCHRVVGSNGALGGYSGGEGAETKRRLLQLEHALLL
ncbi:MAG TPA: methylated-DNA--[protein]-cysteine S-methyltransferase [Stellaceae bacterium]|nr:methylated-DNA--[protein]-cysteine S-methyltransferase [Stellaceae bacterium]